MGDESSLISIKSFVYNNLVIVDFNKVSRGQSREDVMNRVENS